MRPSEVICGDDSISRWYGKDAHWIDIGLPHYVALDHKTENGFEIQISACISLHLELVTTAEDEKARAFESDTAHGTAVSRRIVAGLCRYFPNSLR